MGLFLASILLSLLPPALAQERGWKFSWLPEDQTFSHVKTVFDLNFLAERVGGEDETQGNEYHHWRKVRLQSGRLGDKEVKKVTIWKEVADEERGRILQYRSESYWNKKKELIVLYAVENVQGIETHREYRWREGGLFLHVGPSEKASSKGKKRRRKKRRKGAPPDWRPIPTKERPRSLTLLLASSPYWNSDQRVRFSQLDPWEEKTSEETLHRTEKKVLLGGGMLTRRIEGTQEGGIYYLVRRKDGAAYVTAPTNKLYYESISGYDELEDTRERIRSNSPMQAKAHKLATNTWKKRGSELRNDFLGLRLRSPSGKKWSRIQGLKTPYCFGLEAPSEGASFRIWMRAWGNGDLDEALSQFKHYLSFLVDSMEEIKIERTDFLKAPAFRFTFRGTDLLKEDRWSTRIIAFLHRGVFLALEFRVLPSEKKEWEKDLKRIERSIKFFKPRRTH